MNNLPIINSNSQPTTKSTNKSQANNGAQGTESAKPFGSVLARQIDKSQTPSQVTPPAEKNAADAKTTKDTKSAAGNGEQDKASALPPAPNDPSAALAAMLQLPQEIKTPVVSDPATSAAATTATTADAMTSSATTLSEMITGKAGVSHSALNANAAQANAKADIANLPFAKTDAAMSIAENPLLRNPEMIKNAVMTDSLPGAAQSPQLIAQSAASLAASGLMPNLLTNNKPVDTPQTISAPVGSSNWGDEFSQKISWMSTQQNQVAELHLNPPDLGPLDVVLKVSDNQATALFTSPHSAVREAVENALPKLREILADSGITLGNATVSDQAPRDNNPGGFSGERSNRDRGITGGAAETTDTAITSMPSTSARRHNGMVDTFA